MTALQPYGVRPPTLDLDLLRTFLAVAHFGSFTVAADNIGRTQSTVSTQIHKLEAVLGARLLYRGKRSVSATAQGEELLAFARELLLLEQRAVASVRRPGLSGTVRLGTQDDFANRRLPAFLSAFALDHPAVKVEVFCGLAANLLRQLATGVLDLVLVRQRAESADAQCLWTEPLVWIGDPNARLALADPLPLVLFPEGCFYHKVISETFAAQDLSHRVTYTSSSSASVQAAAKTGLGYSVLARGTVLASVPILAKGHGLPQLPDAKVALHRSPKVRSAAAEQLARAIARDLRPDSVGVGRAGVRTHAPRDSQLAQLA